VLRTELECVFGPALYALYLYGAPTFRESEGIADLDYHAILTEPPTPQERAEYIAACARLASQPGCEDLDGWVILLADARASAEPRHLIKTEMRDGAWPLHRAHWLAGRCVVLHGPPPADIVVSPTWDECRQALAAELAFAVAAPGDSYSVLNCCRILRSMAEREVVQSKFGSAWWAIEHLPAEYGDAIRAGMNRYRGTATAADSRVLAAHRLAIEALAAAALDQQDSADGG
jgi:Domain of unknown function (DUF4111)